MYYLPRFLLPFTPWLRNYRAADLKRDAVAGLTVTLVLIPQSMANAQLAGLPAYHGLYAAVLPAVVGGLWGSSRHMVTGTVAVISLMASAALQPLALAGPEGYIAHMALLALLVGGLQLLFGLLRLGMVVNFLSLPVISGFTNAAAVIIAASQLGKLFGVTVDGSGSSLEVFLRTLASMGNYAHPPSLLMAGAAAGVLALCARFAPRLPAVLTAVVITTFFSWLLNFENNAGASLDRVSSREARLLIERLNVDMKNKSLYGGNLARLEQPPKAEESPEAELERQYRIREQKLFLARASQDAALVGEHLRRMTFFAVEREDGSRDFFLKHSPDLVHKAGSPEQREALAEEGKDAPAQAAGQAAAESGDSRTWRLHVGSGPLDPRELRFSSGGEVVGAVPAGLPHFSLPDCDWNSVLLLLPQALIIAFVGFAESISIAKNGARIQGYRIDANQELVGQGLANIAGGLVLTCPVSGSFSSSAVNFAARARTGLSCVFAGAGALAVLLFLSPALYHLPQPVLAVIVMRATISLVNFEQFRRLWTAQWQDGVIALATFACTLAFAPHLDYGIAAGIVLSLAWYFYQSMHPRISVLSNGPGNTLRDAKVFQLEECRHIAVVHFQGPLFFGNTGVLEDYILKRLETDRDLKHIHLVCSGITSIDASGEDSLAMLVEQTHKAGVEMSFSGVAGSVAEVLERTGVLHMVGLENIFLTPREAVCAIYARVKHTADCETCPLASLFCRESEVAKGYQSYHATQAKPGGPHA